MDLHIEYSCLYPSGYSLFIPSFHLADRSVFDEKTGHLNNIILRTASIITQVENDTIHMLCFQLFHFFGSIGCATTIRAFKIRIEFRQVYVTYFILAAMMADLA